MIIFNSFVFRCFMYFVPGLIVGIMVIYYTYRTIQTDENHTMYWEELVACIFAAIIYALLWPLCITCWIIQEIITHVLPKK